MPLDPEQYQAGSRVRNPDGLDYDVTDTFRGSSGNEFAILTAVDGSDMTLQKVSDVRDSWEARDPEEVQEEREQARQREDDPDPDPDPVTDDPGVTDSNGDTPPANPNPNQ